MKMLYNRCPVCGYPYLIEVFDSQTGEFLYYMCKQCGAKFTKEDDADGNN